MEEVSEEKFDYKINDEVDFSGLAAFLLEDEMGFSNEATVRTGLIGLLQEKIKAFSNDSCEMSKVGFPGTLMESLAGEQQKIIETKPSGLMKFFKKAKALEKFNYVFSSHLLRLETTRVAYFDNHSAFPLIMDVEDCYELPFFMPLLVSVFFRTSLRDEAFSEEVDSKVYGGLSGSALKLFKSVLEKVYSITASSFESSEYSGDSFEEKMLSLVFKKCLELDKETDQRKRHEALCSIVPALRVCENSLLSDGKMVDENTINFARDWKENALDLKNANYLTLEDQTLVSEEEALVSEEKASVFEEEQGCLDGLQNSLFLINLEKFSDKENNFFDIGGLVKALEDLQPNDKIEDTDSFSEDVHASEESASSGYDLKAQLDALKMLVGFLIKDEDTVRKSQLKGNDIVALDLTDLKNLTSNIDEVAESSIESSDEMRKLFVAASKIIGKFALNLNSYTGDHQVPDTAMVRVYLGMIDNNLNTSAVMLDKLFGKQKNARSQGFIMSANALRSFKLTKVENKNNTSSDNEKDLALKKARENSGETLVRKIEDGVKNNKKSGEKENLSELGVKLAQQRNKVAEGKGSKPKTTPKKNPSPSKGVKKRPQKKRALGKRRAPPKKSTNQVKLPTEEVNSTPVVQDNSDTSQNLLIVSPNNERGNSGQMIKVDKNKGLSSAGVLLQLRESNDNEKEVKPVEGSGSTSHRKKVAKVYFDNNLGKSPRSLPPPPPSKTEENREENDGVTTVLTKFLVNKATKNSAGTVPPKSRVDDSQVKDAADEERKDEKKDFN